eukprot:ANDGO_05507.mRNA.1 hypothetical protein
MAGTDVKESEGMVVADTSKFVLNDNEMRRPTLNVGRRVSNIINSIQNKAKMAADSIKEHQELPQVGSRANTLNAQYDIQEAADEVTLNLQRPAASQQDSSAADESRNADGNWTADSRSLIDIHDEKVANYSADQKLPLYDRIAKEMYRVLSTRSLQSMGWAMHHVQYAIQFAIASYEAIVEKWQRACRQADGVEEAAPGQKRMLLARILPPRHKRQMMLIHLQEAVIIAISVAIARRIVLRLFFRRSKGLTASGGHEQFMGIMGKVRLALIVAAIRAAVSEFVEESFEPEKKAGVSLASIAKSLKNADSISDNVASKVGSSLFPDTADTDTPVSNERKFEKLPPPSSSPSLDSAAL